MKMAWFNTADTAEYDTGHTWTSGDQFTLSLNATEQNWGSANDRFMTVSLVETVRNGSNVLTGSTVWSTTEELILDTAHDAPPEGYGANATFSYSINTSQFTGGTEGSGLTLVIAGSGSRGYNFDNVYLDVTPVPEPSTTVALLGLGGIALLLRRRR
ncbi:PEP-CTERM sorting domain-containing protein [Akkermansiaceae bacterium]|nr:PEP-CTERM sorting domain-containing protein [Akkermansiaceae bacterium]